MTDEEIAVAIAEHGKEIGSLKHRMNDVEKIVNVVHQLAEEMVGLTKEIKYMNTSLASLTAKVSQLEGKPCGPLGDACDRTDRGPGRGSCNISF